MAKKKVVNTSPKPQSKLSAIAASILAAIGGSYAGVDQYQKHSDQEFVVMRAQGVSSLSFVDARNEALELGEIVGQLDDGYRVKSSKAKVDAHAVSSGLIVEPVIKYEKPTPPSRSWFGCDFKPPSPEPTPRPDDPGPQIVDWGQRKVNALLGIEHSQSGNVTVCVLDTGIDRAHPDLRHFEGRNFTSPDAGDYEDRDGHGTHTAGLVAAINNDFGSVGASQATLLVGKVLGDDGSGYNDWIAAGINWCVDRGADIISMSLGGPQQSAVIKNALQYATSQGIQVFAAAGNDGSSFVGYPAGYVMPNLFSISALDKDDSLAWFSNYGKIEYTAPGVDILSTVPLGYARYSGTSMATPLAAGIAAIFHALGKPLRARPMGDSMYYGQGMLDASLAVDGILP